MTVLRVAIVQDYVPRYRLELFGGMVERLEEKRIKCVVVAGLPEGAVAGRGDSVEGEAWLRLAEPREVTFGPNGRPHFVMYGSDRHWRDCDAVVMPLRGTSLDLTAELLRRRFTHRRVAVWGQLSRGPKPPNAVDRTIENWQMRRSDHVFSYTDRGAEAAIASGIDTARVTALMNSTDVSQLLSAYRALSYRQLAEAKQQYGLTHGKTFAFIGRLDPEKRVEFLAEVLDQLWGRDPAIKVLVGGRGRQAERLATAIERGQVHRYGYAGPAEKAEMLALSQALINPGGIGLIAVEALAIGIPILTATTKWHGPEYDYLMPSRDVLTSSDDPAAYAELMIRQLGAGDSLPRHRGRPYPTIDGMIERFSNGVLKMLEVA